MCGIVGYLGQRDATPIVLEGLKKLEYRGYNSAGLALLGDGRIELRRSVGKLDGLERVVQREPPGAPSESATPAGPPTASLPRRTVTRTSTAAPRSSSSTTESSKTTASSAPNCATTATPSAPKPTPKSSFTSSKRSAGMGRVSRKPPA